MGGAFWRFWSVELATETGIGLAVIALQTMVVLDLGGGATEVGWLSSARWLPYMVLGLLVGAIVEGLRRRTVMIVSDLVRALVLGGLAVVWLAGGGALWVLLLAVVLLGTASLVNDAASQAFVPRLVGRERLLPAHQRLDAGSNAAQSAGPAVSGAVIAWLGAPISLLLAAGAHLVSSIVLWTLPRDEASRKRSHGLGRSILHGLRFVHRHPRLGPFARWTHVWFLCNGAAMTLLVPLVLIELDAGPAGLGLALGVLGATTLAGTALAGLVADRLGNARTIILERAVMPFAWGAVALAGLLPLPALGGLALALAGLAVLGVVMGLSNPNEMTLRQRATPDRMQARMNATMRTVNRAMIVVAAPLAGLLGDAIGFGVALAVVCAGFAVAAVGIAASPLARGRTAR
ncbi:MFS transporter [Agrococcus baldri]|uniref:MFS transporter n=1 Tax=Agrococcus baldri TaxID=153730 RepID=A0AA87USL5_9MICO|nr:MFS transporter [Agrococcus baldri]GEK80983.1 MFS transporter [Agrococcus baldri]